MMAKKQYSFDAKKPSSSKKVKLENPDEHLGLKKLTSPARKCKYIAIYNYKGGVAKTTVTRELAAAMIKAGFRIGLIDADPQCNLTTFFLLDEERDAMMYHDVIGDTEGSDQEDIDDAPPTPTEPGVIQFPLDENATPIDEGQWRKDNVPGNLYHVLRPVLGEIDSSTFLEMKLLTPREWEKDGPEVAAVREIQVPNSCGRGRLFLQPGSARIVEFETNLEQASHMGGGLGPWLGAFRCLMNKMAEECELDYILVDCSPSSGTLNKHMVMSCDYILPPAFPDLGCLTSLHGMLTYVLPMWLKYRGEILEKIKKAPPQYHLPQKPPKLLPVMVNSFTRRKKPGQNFQSIAISHSQFICTIRQLVRNDNRQIPDVVRNIMVPEFSDDSEPCMVWAVLEHLEKVLTISMKYRIPMSWLAENPDWAQYSRTFNKPEEKLPSQKDRCKNVYKRMSSIVRFIDNMHT